MFKIVSKRNLNPTVTMMDIEAPLVAKKAEAGQFIILAPMRTASVSRSPSRALTAKRVRLKLYFRLWEPQPKS